MANEDVKRALMEALGGSTRPRSRPQGMGESGKTISDADKLKMMMMKTKKLLILELILKKQ